MTRQPPRNPPPRDGAMAQLRLHLHGEASVSRQAAASLPLRGRAAAVVALAALEPGISRERVAALVWPDAPNPRQNLRQQLLRFRQALGGPLIEGDEQLRLAQQVVLQQPAQGAELLGTESAGDDEFGHWLQVQRERERSARRAPLHEALARAEAEGDLDAALQQARSLLALDPHDEAPHTTLMRLHYLRGEPAAGLAAYQRLDEMLRVRYASRPSRASAELAEALRRAQPSSPASAPGEPRAAAPTGALALQRQLPVTLRRPPRLVGRQAERAAVQQAWAQGQAVVLEGEAGLGKSRLMSEIVSESVAEGVAQGVTPSPAAATTAATTTATGSAGPAAAALHLLAAGRPGDAGAPYATLTRLLHPLLAAGAPGLDAGAREALSLLAPGLHSGPSGGALEGEAAPRLRPGALQAAVAALLDRAGVHTVALDDLHFADDATLDLLAGLAAAPDMSRRWLFATRPAEGSVAVGALRDGLAELNRLRVVPLTPLDAAATATLIDTLAIQGLQGDSLAPALVRHTGGNPLYLLETLKLGLADGSLRAGRLPRPEAVGSLIERRLRQLSPRALSLARVAAVAGVDFGVELAEQALAVPAVELSDAWGELQSAQVLRDNAFAHDLVVDAVLRSIPAPIAEHLHALLAAWLGRRQAEPARVAAHWQAAGEHRRAADAWLEAAQVADRRLRFRESMQCFERAAELFGSLADAPARHRALRQAIEQASMLDLSIEDFAAQVERLIDSAPDLAERAAASVFRLRIHELKGDSPALVREAQALIELARSQGLRREEAIGLMALGTARSNLQQLAEALPDFERVAVLGAELDDLELQAAGLSAQGTILLRLGRRVRALSALDAARELFGRGKHLLRLAMVEQQTSIALLGSGRPAAALEAAERALGSALAAEPPLDMLAHVWLARSMALRQLGRYAESLAAIDEPLGLVDARELAVADRLRLELAQTYLHLGRTDLAQRQLAQARAPTRLALAEQQRALYLELQLRALSPSTAPASAALLPTALAQGEPRRRCELLRAWSALAPPDERAALLDDALRIADEFDLADERCTVQAELARQLLAQGQVHAATALARIALADESTTPAGYPPTVAAIAHAVLGAGGDATAARRALERALDWVERASATLPPEFRSSFRERNPVNRALLAAASQRRPNGG